ncbi:right-handed parallel beta-helix repeat-containing protein [Cellulophaga sp. HaHaR_3_176]|uniref:right-handed parallel beta-helix repeat-containing protein n=1 Tax=Cellulophaga sp. HaHaR_3_176 TaxID=1942464 RepID=UPI001C1F7F44|nr:right-handed parallel beta-helix repeat-containing protein [Cellulophaga sp. HaHaR_3_176]QWX85155.1 right-handed parallel beta-helix repeat-containing protein [Cellulophaga sp. HaHaR_3_176]
MKKFLLKITCIGLLCITATSCSNNDDLNDLIVDDSPDSGIESGDYVSAIGVPNAWISPDIASPERPSTWDTEQIGYYFVEYAVGSDSDNMYGTPSAPRKTIPSPVPAGSYVVVAGDYHYVQNDIRLRGEGTADAWVAGESGPVWVVSDTENRAEITGKKLLVSGSYVYIDNFYFHSSGSIQIGSYSPGYQVDHIMIRNSEMKGEVDVAGGVLISTVGLEDEPAKDIIIYNNKAHRIGPLDSDVDIDARGCSIQGYTSNMWVVNNEFSNSSAGLQVEAGSIQRQATTHHIYIAKNHIFDIAQAGIGIKYALDIIISENVIHDIIDTPWSPSKGIGFQYAPDRVWILFNEISKVNTGIRGGSDNGGAGTVGESVFIIGNLIKDVTINGTAYNGATSGIGIEINNGATPRYIINNTIVDSDIGVANGYYNSTMFIENNIISNTRDFDIMLEDSYLTGSRSTLKNNHFDAEAKITWSNGITHDLASFQAAFNKGEGCISAAPLFVDASSDDFSLQATSSAIDTALQPSDLTFDVYAHFQSLYGEDIRVDINQVARPSTGLWDMGAYTN